MDKAFSGKADSPLFQTESACLVFVQRRLAERSEPIAINRSELMKINHSEPMTINRSELDADFDFHPLGIHNRDHLGTLIFITSE